MPTREAEAGPHRPAHENPFRSSRVEALAFRLDGRPLDEAGWNTLLDRFDSLGRRAALVGPKGSGKTTLLEEIERRFVEAGWQVHRLRLSIEAPHPAPDAWRELARLGPEDLLTVDGAEQLSPPTWWRLRWRVRRAGALLVTTHRPGRLPTLHEHHTTPALLEDLVGRLAPDLADRLAPDLPALFTRHRGNLRECLRDLYDAWAKGDGQKGK